jgi:hypothetical protein
MAGNIPWLTRRRDHGTCEGIRVRPWRRRGPEDAAEARRGPRRVGGRGSGARPAVDGRRTRQASEEGSGGAAKGLRLGTVLGGREMGGRWAACASRPGDGKPEEENPPPSTGLNFQKIAHLQTKIMKIAPYGSLVHQ